MFILLAAATTFEIQPTIDLWAAPRPAPGPTAATTPGPAADSALAPTADGKTALRIEPLITGVGSLATTWALTRQIDRERPDLIIQAGIAGCFTGRQPGDVVAIKDETLADLGVWEDQRFKTLFDLRLADPDALPFNEGRLVNPYTHLLSLTGLAAVSAITVNEITTSATRIGWYQQNTAAVVESMEGGGLHYVCLQEKIPFLQLRSVSNDIGVRDKTKWDIKSAITNLNQQLTILLRRLEETGAAALGL